MNITRSWWNDTKLVIDTTEGPLAWTPGAKISWDVGPVTLPRDTPNYVFEPRPVTAIEKDLATAATPEAKRRLEAEQRLCAKPHAVYIAWYGTLPKVGMTQEDRLMERLREQGADAGFVAAVADDRAGARAIEKSIAFRYHIPEWRTSKEILPQLARPVDIDRVTARAEDLRGRLAASCQAGPLFPITDHPLPVLSQRPHRVAAEGHHEGTIIGAKGNHLVFQTSSTAGRLAVGPAPLHVIKRGDLEGRTLSVTDAN